MSGKNVCPKATKGPGGCIKPCLNTSGRGQMNSVQQARINKTNYFWNNKNGFLWELSKEIELLKSVQLEMVSSLPFDSMERPTCPGLNIKLTVVALLWIFILMSNFMIIPKF